MHAILLPSSRITRLKNSLFRRNQATFAARLPIVGRRVPLRRLWTRRSPAWYDGFAWSRRPSVANRTVPDPRVALAAATATTRAARERAAPVLRPVVDRGRALASGAAGQAADRGRHMASQAAVTLADLAPEVKKMRNQIPAAPRMRPPSGLRFVAAIAATVMLAFYLDPTSGRRRRALLRDKASRAGHAAAKAQRRISRRGRFAKGVARGVAHGTRTLVTSNGHRPAGDEETLVARVRSEVFRNGGISAGIVNIDAYEGCVTLRGQLESESDIRRLVSATQRVEGVREVRSYLHLPDQLPPNKAESYEQAERHLPSL